MKTSLFLSSLLVGVAQGVQYIWIEPVNADLPAEMWAANNSYMDQCICSNYHLFIIGYIEMWKDFMFKEIVVLSLRWLIFFKKLAADLKPFFNLTSCYYDNQKPYIIHAWFACKYWYKKIQLILKNAKQKGLS